MDLAATKLQQLIMGFRVTQLISLTARLNLADRLANAPRSAEELAVDVTADPESLYRILRALASIGLITELADRFFALTSLGELLRTDSPGSMRNVAVLYGEDWLWQAYANLSFSAQTGRPAFPEVHGVSFYDFLTRHPRAAAVFQAAMTGFSEQEAAAVLDAYDFVGVKAVLDVGAGHGALLAAILRQHPHVSGIAFDLPSAMASAERLFDDAGLRDRAAFVGGDFFTEVPSGADLLVLKSVLHNWDDASARRILRTCRRASSPETRLLVIERLIPAGPAPAEAKLFDINMLVMVGGRERTQNEYAALLADTGFVLTRVISTASPLTLLEALPDDQTQ